MGSPIQYQHFSTFVKIDTSTHSLTAQALSEHTDLEDVVLKAIPLTGGVSSEVWEELIQGLALSSISVYCLFQQKKIMIKIQLLPGSPLATRNYRLLDRGKASLYALLLLRRFSLKTRESMEKCISPGICCWQLWGTEYWEQWPLIWSSVDSLTGLLGSYQFEIKNSG